MGADYVPGECGVFLNVQLNERCGHPVDPINGAWRMCSCCYEVFKNEDDEVQHSDGGGDHG